MFIDWLDHPAPHMKRSINEDFHIESPRVRQGFPLPGNYSGLSGVLSVENIPAANAFMTNFVWFLIIFAISLGGVPIIKFILELAVGTELISEKRLSTFRRRWRLYVIGLLGKLLLSGFHMLIFTATYQLSLNGKAGVVFFAVVVFLLIMSCMCVIAGRAILAALKGTDQEPYTWSEKIDYLCRNSWTDLRDGNRPRLAPVNHDTHYLCKFGWLSARYRLERWWWFIPSLAYEFLRGCILGAAIDNPFGQIFVTLALEVIMLAYSVWMKPYEATRLNVLAVYLLGISKVLTISLSAAFHPQFSVPRITTTVIGVFIIIIHGLLTLVAIALIILGTFCTHLSLRRRNVLDHSEENVPQASDEYLGMRYLSRVEDSSAQQAQEPPKPDTKEES